MGGPGASLQSLEPPVMYDTEDGLEEEKDEQHDPDDGMRVALGYFQEAGARRDPHYAQEIQPQPRGDDVQHEGYYLDDPVRDECPSARDGAQQDGAEGK